jgi:hypothetical protein
VSTPALERLEEFCGERLSGPERIAVNAIWGGRAAALGEGDEIRALVVRAVCLNPALAPAGRLGRVSITGGSVGGELDLSGHRLDFPLCFENTKVGQVVLIDARIVALEMIGGSCAGITAGRLEVAHDVVLGSGLTVTGPVRMPSAIIAGDLNLGGASLCPTSGASLLFDGARIGARVYLRSSTRDKVRHRFVAKHGVYGRNSRIAGGVICANGQFERELDFERAQIRGELSLFHATVGTSLNLNAVQIDRDLTMNETTINAREVKMARARVGGTLTWEVRRSVQKSEVDEFDVDLTQAQVGYLNDDLGRWHGAKLTLDGFAFDGIKVAAPVRHAASFRHWLDEGRPLHFVRRQAWLPAWVRREDDSWLGARRRWLNSQKLWSADPYDRTAAALNRAGEAPAARAISIEREVRRRHGRWRDRVPSWIFGLFIGHGYRPLQAVGWAVVAVAVAFAVLPHDSASYSGKADAPTFDAGLYALDAFLPIDLKYVSGWTPHGQTASYITAGTIALGWIVTALLVAAVTGLIRRD